MSQGKVECLPSSRSPTWSQIDGGSGAARGPSPRRRCASLQIVTFSCGVPIRNSNLLQIRSKENPLFSLTSHTPALVSAEVCEITQSFGCTLTFKGRDGWWMFANSQFIQLTRSSLSLLHARTQMKNIFFFPLTHLFISWTICRT